MGAKANKPGRGGKVPGRCRSGQKILGEQCPSTKSKEDRGAEYCGGYCKGCPVDCRIEGLGSVMSSPARSGGSPGRKRIQAYFECHRTLRCFEFVKHCLMSHWGGHLLSLSRNVEPPTCLGVRADDPLNSRTIQVLHLAFTLFISVFVYSIFVDLRPVRR